MANHKHKWASWFEGRFDFPGGVTEICPCGLKRETNWAAHGGLDYRRYYRGGVAGKRIYIRTRVK